MQLYEVLGKGLHIAKRVRESELEQRFAVAGEFVELTEHAAAPLLALKRLRPVAPVPRPQPPNSAASAADPQHRHVSTDMGEHGWAGGLGPQSPDTRNVEATDGAVVLAEKHGIDLSAVKGTGAGGRITKRDVEQHTLLPKSVE